MLALALTLLLTVTGIVAVLTIIDSAIKGRNAYERLLREAALMEAGFVMQVEAQELRVRRAPARFTPDRRSPVLLRTRPVPACAAA
jgi:hypothetical protein